MTREELEEFISTHTVYEIAEFIVTKQVDRYSAGFDSGYDLGFTDALNNSKDYYWNWDKQEWTKKDMNEA